MEAVQFVSIRYMHVSVYIVHILTSFFCSGLYKRNAGDLLFQKQSSRGTFCWSSPALLHALGQFKNGGLRPRRASQPAPRHQLREANIRVSVARAVLLMSGCSS